MKKSIKKNLNRKLSKKRKNLQKAGFVKDSHKKIGEKIGEFLITANSISDMIDKHDSATVIKKIEKIQKGGEYIFTKSDSNKIYNMIKKIKKNLSKKYSKVMSGGANEAQENGKNSPTEEKQPVMAPEEKLKAHGLLRYYESVPLRIPFVRKILESVAQFVEGTVPCSENLSFIDLLFMSLGSIWFIGAPFDFIEIVWSVLKGNFKTAFIVFLNRVAIFTGDSIKIAYISTWPGIKDYYKNLDEIVEEKN